MKENGDKSGTIKVLTYNRRALHDYTILSKLEVGIALVGTEVKTLRQGGVSLTGAYVQADLRGLWLLQANFPPYDFGNRFNHEGLRPRRLLAHKREILKLKALSEQKGMTLVPLSLYCNAKGLIKLEIGVAKGKVLYDKRESIKRREADVAAKRAMKLATHR